MSLFPLTISRTALALLTLNLLSFLAFWWDKRQARGGGWRVSESTLLLLALLGGTPGAFAGRAAFRHKTRKQPFVARLWVIAGLQVAAAGWLAWEGVR